MHRNKQSSEITDEVLFAEYKSVYRYALSICRNETEALDLTQETFLKAIQSVGDFKGNSSLYTWLCTILKHIWLNKCKKLSREVSPEEINQEIPAPEVSIVQMVTDKDASRQIHLILHKLEEPYKEVFSLRVFGELPFADIAGLFNRSESWARVTYHRAKKMILEQLRKDGWL